MRLAMLSTGLSEFSETLAHQYSHRLKQLEKAQAWKIREVHFAPLAEVGSRPQSGPPSPLLNPTSPEAAGICA